MASSCMSYVHYVARTKRCLQLDHADCRRRSRLLCMRPAPGATTAVSVHINELFGFTINVVVQSHTPKQFETCNFNVTFIGRTRTVCQSYFLQWSVQKSTSSVKVEPTITTPVGDLSVLAMSTYKRLGPCYYSVLQVDTNARYKQ